MSETTPDTVSEPLLSFHTHGFTFFNWAEEVDFRTPAIQQNLTALTAQIEALELRTGQRLDRIVTIGSEYAYAIQANIDDQPWRLFIGSYGWANGNLEDVEGILLHELGHQKTGAVLHRNMLNLNTGPLMLLDSWEHFYAVDPHRAHGWTVEKFGSVSAAQDFIESLRPIANEAIRITKPLEGMSEREIADWMDRNPDGLKQMVEAMDMDALGNLLTDEQSSLIGLTLDAQLQEPAMREGAIRTMSQQGMQAEIDALPPLRQFGSPPDTAAAMAIHDVLQPYRSASENFMNTISRVQRADEYLADRFALRHASDPERYLSNLGMLENLETEAQRATMQIEGNTSLVDMNTHPPVQERLASGRETLARYQAEEARASMQASQHAAQRAMLAHNQANGVKLPERDTRPMPQGLRPGERRYERLPQDIPNPGREYRVDVRQQQHLRDTSFDLPDDNLIDPPSRFETRMIWRDGVKPEQRIMDFIEPDANGYPLRVTREATPLDAFVRNSALVASPTIDHWDMHVPAMPGIDAARDAMQGAGAVRNGGRIVTSIIPTGADNLLWTGAFALGIGGIGALAQSNEEVRGAWSDLRNGSVGAVINRIQQAPGRVLDAASTGAREAGSEMLGVADANRGDTMRASANLIENIVGVPFATAALDESRIQRAMAAVPAADVAQLRGFGIPTNGARTGNAPLDDYIAQVEQIQTNAALGQDFGAKVGRVPVSPAVTQAELERVARRYLATGGDIHTAMRLLPTGQAEYARMEAAFHAVNADDVAAVLQVPVPATLAPTGDVAVDAYVASIQMLDKAVENNARLDAMRTTNSMFGLSSMDGRSEAIYAIMQTDPEEARIAREAAARRYLRDGGSAAELAVRTTGAPFATSAQEMTKLLEAHPELTHYDGAVEGSVADGKLDVLELARAMHAMGISVASVDKNGDHFASFDELKAQFQHAPNNRDTLPGR